MKLSWFTSLATVLLVTTMYFAGGCGKRTSTPQAGSTDTAAGADHEAGDEHGHAETGPHGGSLIELGTEQYHAELVHDETAGTISVYLLDGAAKNAVATDALELIVNVKNDGQGEQFKLAAKADASDPAGKSSRFVSSDGQLVGDLDDETAEAELVAEINGKQFRGAIEHHHGHEEGEHAEHDHE